MKGFCYANEKGLINLHYTIQCMYSTVSPLLGTYVSVFANFLFTYILYICTYYDDIKVSNRALQLAVTI